MSDTASENVSFPVQGLACYINTDKINELHSQHLCDICDIECPSSLWYRCTICPDFDVCPECFTGGRMIHQDHEFEETGHKGADLAYLVELTRSTSSVVETSAGTMHNAFARVDLRCYTCFDHYPGCVKGVWLLQNGKLLDARTLSNNQLAVWSLFQREAKVSKYEAFFLLDLYDWDVQAATEGFRNDYDTDEKSMTALRSQLEEPESSYMSDLPIRMSDLATSKRNGCRLCSLVYRGLAHAHPTLIEEDSYLQILIRADSIKVSAPSDSASAEFWTWHFNPIPGFEPPWIGMKPWEKRSRNFASEECFDLLRTWIRDCDDTHQHKNCSGAEQAFPTRLLVIDENPGEASLRLIEPTRGSKGRYIALSHCWGTVPITTTIGRNIDTMKQGISIERLPATFRDAITCARKLNISYIWIDSLCIIQDSAPDWRLESAKMCDYYLNAWLVIVAASAEGDTQGFLGNRSVIHFGIPLETEEGSGQHNMCIQHAQAHILSYKTVSASTELSGDRTSLRAWCLQETILARRSISFHHSELVWSCHESCTCECGRARHDYHKDLTATQKQDRCHYQPGEYGGTRFSEPALQWRYTGRPFTEFTSLGGLYEEWRSMIIPLYTERKMTKRTDKLPAISGLAQFVGAQQKGRYLAGIWANDIQSGLLWQIQERQICSKSADPMGPSFSWASVEPQVVYSIPGHVGLRPNDVSLLGDIHVDVVSDNLIFDGHSEYGKCDGGSITISGLVSKVVLHMEAEKLMVRPCGEPELYLRPRLFGPYDRFHADTYLEEVSVVGKSGDFIRTMRRSMKSQHTMLSPNVELPCLIVADVRLPSKPSQNGSKEVDSEEYALLVLGNLEYKDGCWCYERLGKVVFLFKPGEGSQWLSQAKRREIVLC